MPKSRDKIEKSLKKKGFQRKDTHHRYYHYYHSGRCTAAYAYLSMGTNYKDYSNDLLSKMKRTLFLDTNSQIKDLIDCPMSEDDYKKILINKNIISDLN